MRSLALEHDGGGDEAAAWVQEAAQQGGRDGEGRVGHHVELRARQAQVGGVGLHHGDAAAEAGAQVAGSTWVSFDGDHPLAGLEQRGGDDSRAGPDVEHQRTGREARLNDEACRPPRIELVPTPSSVRPR